VDSQHQCAVKHAAAKLSELQAVYRRFQAWYRDEVLWRMLTDVANKLRDKGALDYEECFVDATFLTAKGGGADIGAPKARKRMKIMAIIAAFGQRACDEPSRSPFDEIIAPHRTNRCEPPHAKSAAATPIHAALAR
jgi:hypothetical protein